MLDKMLNSINARAVEQMAPMVLAVFVMQSVITVEKRSPTESL